MRCYAGVIKSRSSDSIKAAKVRLLGVLTKGVVGLWRSVELALRHSVENKSISKACYKMLGSYCAAGKNIVCLSTPNIADA